MLCIKRQGCKRAGGSCLLFVRTVISDLVALGMFAYSTPVCGTTQRNATSTHSIARMYSYSDQRYTVPVVHCNIRGSSCPVGLRQVTLVQPGMWCAAADAHVSC